MKTDIDAAEAAIGAQIGQDTRGTRDTRRRDIGIKLAVIARQMRQRFDERVEEVGVTRASYMLIATVAANAGATQREIAAKLEVSDVTAGRLIDRICADGLLERRENPQDRRAYCVYLTDAARPLLGRLVDTAEVFEAEVFATMDDEDLHMLGALLDKLAINVGATRLALADRKLAASDAA